MKVNLTDVLRGEGQDVASESFVSYLPRRAIRYKLNKDRIWSDHRFGNSNVLLSIVHA